MCCKISTDGGVLNTIESERYFIFVYRELQVSLQEKWLTLKGRSTLDCVRIYLTCTRKWPYFGASLFQAKVDLVLFGNNLDTFKSVYV